jgi:hypothetical protein
MVIFRYRCKHFAVGNWTQSEGRLSVAVRLQLEGKPGSSMWGNEIFAIDAYYYDGHLCQTSNWITFANINLAISECCNQATGESITFSGTRLFLSALQKVWTFSISEDMKQHERGMGTNEEGSYCGLMRSATPVIWSRDSEITYTSRRDIPNVTNYRGILQEWPVSEKPSHTPRCERVVPNIAQGLNIFTRAFPCKFAQGT